MAKIQYTVRFYRAHDMDIIFLALTRDFDVMRAIYSAATAFSHGQAFVIEIPPPETDSLPQMKYSYRHMLCLDRDKDSDLISLLERVRPGYRNSFLKNLLRLYLACPFNEHFFLSPGDMAVFEDRMQGIRQGRRTAKAGAKGKGGVKTAGDGNTPEPGSAPRAVKAREVQPNPVTESDAGEEAAPQGQDMEEIMDIFENL